MNVKKVPVGAPKTAFSEPATAGMCMDRLREINMKHQSIIENLRKVFFHIDAAGQWVFLSPAWTELTGYAIADCIGRPFWEYLHPGERERCLQLFRRLMNQEIENGWSQVLHLVRDGGERWFEVKVKPVLEGGMTVVGIRGTLLDIADRKLVEQALAESQERYGQLFMHSRVAMLIVDPEGGRITDANNAAAAFYGYTVDELRALAIQSLTTADPGKVTKYLTIAGNSKGHVFSQVQNRLKDGSVRDVEVYTATARIAGKTVIHAIIFDVTGRRQMEEQLARSQERLSLVLAGAKAGIWDWDMVSGRVYYDKRWKAILGYEEHEIAESYEEWHSRWHPEDAARIERAMQDYLEGRVDKYEIEHRLRHKDGTYRWILTTGKITYDQAGRAVRWAGSNIDITDRRRAERMLHNAYRLRRRSDLINDIIEGKPLVFEKDRYLARSSGIDFNVPAFCCLILDDCPEAEGYERRREFRENALPMLEELPYGVVWNGRVGIGVLCHKRAAMSWTEEILAETANSIRERLKALHNEFAYFVGISELHEPPGSLKKMYHEARCAALAARSQGVAGRTVRYRDAGIFQFLPAVGGREEAMNFVKRQIGRLLEYDSQKGTDYLATLEEILRGLSIRETADKLYLHPKTLLFRRNRIQAILQVSLDSPETRLTLALATKLLRLYK